jgi:hypothetical protein
MRVHRYDRNMGLFLAFLMVAQVCAMPIGMVAQSRSFYPVSSNKLGIAFEEDIENVEPETLLPQSLHTATPRKGGVERPLPEQIVEALTLPTELPEPKPESGKPEKMLPVLRVSEDGGGPSQPEVQSFAQAGTADMVNPSNGAFTYNIPLIDVGGYPINIFYNNAPTMDQEASMVGLGWNLNLGSITRTMRGLPDDFNGDVIKKEMNVRDNVTLGTNVSANVELFGFLGLGAQLGIQENNYNGMGFTSGFNMDLSIGGGTKDNKTTSLGINGSRTLGYTPGDGIHTSNSISAKVQTIDGKSMGGSIGYSDGFSTRSGALASSINLGINVEKNVDKSNLLNSSFVFNRAVPSYTPNFDMPFMTNAAHYRVKVGGEIWGLHPSGAYAWSTSVNKLRTNRMYTTGYGTLYLQNSKGGDTTLTDFNREKDGPYSRYSPYLSMHNITPDIYSASGQGMSGSFELKRSEVGMYNDKMGYSTSNDESFGGEVGFGTGAHFGIDVTVVENSSKSGSWKKDNTYRAPLNFKGLDASDPLYEPAYFKSAGELTSETDATLLSDYGGDVALTPQLDVNTGLLSGNGVNLVNNQFSPSMGAAISTNHFKRRAREKRNEGITYLTAQEASVGGIFKKIKKFNLTVGVGAQWAYNYTELPRIDELKKPHHFSEIIAYKGDGSRYVYGVPAYNIQQKEFTFSVAASSPQRSADDREKGVVVYTPEEKSIDNKSGKDNYFTMLQTPGYAHSFLLSAVLSTDYLDNDGIEGPSEYDQGDYVLFNYGRSSDNYGWRTPNTEPFKANFEEGMRSEQSDNKANFVSGTKEVWYPHSIETKLYIAKFYYSQRLDAVGTDEDGTMVNAQRLLKLDKIELFSKMSFVNSMNTSLILPVKVVNFNYEYSLCKGTPNSQGATSDTQGKLTLKSVYFTYEKSFKGKKSQYDFSYGENGGPNSQANNPNFSNRKVSRWGGYQEPPSGLNTGEYPYVIQNKEKQDLNSNAWSMTGVKMPGGGKVEVKYESHDYAYTQERRAMEMTNIIGFAKDVNSISIANGIVNKLYEINSALRIDNNNIAVFDIDQDIIWTSQAIKNAYFKDLIGDDRYIQFKSFVKLDNSTTPRADEYITGYAQVADAGLATTATNKKVGYFIMKNLSQPITGTSPIYSNFYNPIAWASWKFTRMNLNKLIFDTKPTLDGTNSFSLGYVIDLYQRGQTVLDNMPGGDMSGYLQANLFSQTVDVSRTWVRLCNPNGKKLSGGSRVKSLTIYDKWDQMNNANLGTAYGTEYSYTTVENGKVISSGVASNEPGLGGEENPYRQPAFYADHKDGLADDHVFQEEPIGESLMPGPQIVYSKVSIRTTKYNSAVLGAQPAVATTNNTPSAAVIANSSGTIVNEYFTAKDFPSYSKASFPTKWIHEPSTSFVGALIKSKVEDYMTVSQGFVVEVNDMAGKPSAVWNYDDKGTRLTGTKYYYKTAGGKLSNTVKSFNRKTGVLEDQTIGLDYTISFDSRESLVNTRTGGIGANGDLITPFFLIPTAWPSVAEEEVRFRSISMVKHIKRFGLMERIEKFDGGSKIVTEDIAYDGETGEVLLTKTMNEHDDPIYQFKYPAHLAYEDMRSVFQNSRAYMSLSATLQPQASNVLRQSDEVILQYTVPASGATAAVINYRKLWVASPPSNPLVLIDEKGKKVLGVSTWTNISLLVSRPAYRNMQTVEIGNITSKVNPFDASNRLSVGSNTKVLNATAVEFKNIWPKVCSYSCILDNGENCYLNGAYGIWKPVKSYTYLTPRNYSVLATNEFDTRRDGVFTDYSPFWKLSGSQWVKDDNNWKNTAEMTKVKNANELESKDPLDHYTSQQLGYLDTKVVMTAQNAKYGEIFFDSYEDYLFSPRIVLSGNNANGSNNTNASACINMQRKFRLLDINDGNPVLVTSTFAHTGNYSFKLSAGHTAQFLFNDGCDGELAEAHFEGTTDYVISGWVKLGNNPNNYQYDNVNIMVNQIAVFKPKGEIIDGWQRVYGKFKPGSGTPIIQVVNSSGEIMYLDDIRIHPAKSSVKTFVYDCRTNKVMAELDDNNYATFYEYDQSGNLERLKKETERGTYTIKEVKAGIKK